MLAFHPELYFLEQNKFNKKVTGIEPVTLDGSAHFLCLQSQAFSTELSW